MSPVAVAASSCASRSDDAGDGLGWPGGPDLAPGPAGDLPAVVLGLADGRGDRRVRLAEDVGEEEHGPLGGRQRVEHDEEAERHRLGQLGGRLRGRSSDRSPASDTGSGSHGPDVVLPAPWTSVRRRSRARRVVVVVSHAAGVSTDVLVGAGPPEPGVLHHVLGVGERAEHPVGEPEQPGPLGGEGGVAFASRRHRSPAVGVGGGGPAGGLAAGEGSVGEEALGAHPVTGEVDAGDAGGLDRRPAGQARRRAPARPGW